MTSTYQYPIYKAPDVNLRQQIMEHLQSLFWRTEFSMVKNSVDAGEDVLIPEGYQMLVMDDFTFNGGTLTIEGELFVLEPT